MTVFISENMFHEDPIYSYFYGFLAFLAIQLSIALWLSVSDSFNTDASAAQAPARDTRWKAPKNGEVWVTVRLSKDATEALQALVSAHGADQTEAAVIDHILIKYQKALRKRLLDDW